MPGRIEDFDAHDFLKTGNEVFGEEPGTAVGIDQQGAIFGDRFLYHAEELTAEPGARLRIPTVRW